MTSPSNNTTERKHNMRKNFTEETREKMRAAHTGKHHSELTKWKMSVAHKGKKHSEETKRKMSEAHIGKKMTVETRQKMAESHRGKKSEPQKEKTTTKKTMLGDRLVLKGKRYTARVHRT